MGTNLFMIMTPLLMATTVIAGLSCLVAGLCVSKFMVGDTYVSGPIDSGLTEEMMNRYTCNMYTIPTVHDCRYNDGTNGQGHREYNHNSRIHRS